MAKGQKTQGQRQDLTEDNSGLGDGEYGKHYLTGNWYARPPGSDMGNLTNHDVTEHEDGTISVSPSILVESWKGTWHGYLERGVWREV